MKFRNMKKALGIALIAAAALVVAAPTASATPPPHRGTLTVCSLPTPSNCQSHSELTADPPAVIINSKNKPDFSLSATGMEASQTYNIKYWDTLSGGNCHDNGTVLTSTTSDASGTIASANYNLPVLPNGDYRFCITDTDNTSGQGIPVTILN